MKKKAQIQLQFNWIFIGVVGAVVLIIFLSIISGIRKTSEKSLASDALTYYDEIFTSMQSFENTENSPDLLGFELDIDSEEDFCYYYTITGSDLGGRSIEYLPVFSPDNIRTKALSYSLGWDMPFRINYFLYLTSPDIAYVSVGNNEIEESLPNHLTLEKVDDAGDYENQNYYKIRFFSFDNDPSSYNLHRSVRNLDDNQVSAVYFKDNTIKFYEKDNDEFVLAGETYYIDDSTILAGIYSENLGSYECNLEKAITRINKVSKVLMARLDLIKKSSLLNSCSDSLYSQGENMLFELIKETNKVEITKQSLSNMNTIRSSLQNLNENLNENSCPTIY